MQAMSMIETSVQSLDNVVAAKPARSQTQDESFGKVFSEQRQPERTQPAQAKRPEQPQAKAVEKAPKQAEHSQPVKAEIPHEQQAEQTVADQQSPPAEAPVKQGPKLQQTLVALMHVIAGGETPELVEEYGSAEELLTQLVEQLETSELQGEQVLAGIDLTALSEQLQSVDLETDAELVQQLAEQLSVELTTEIDLQSSALAATGELQNQAGKPQIQAGMAQARQLLQRVLDTVASQQGSKGAEAVTMGEAAISDKEDIAVPGRMLSKETTEEIDPRFANLLKPRSDSKPLQPQQSLREQVQSKLSDSQPAQQAVQATTEQGSGQTKLNEVVEQFGRSAQQGAEKLLQQVQTPLQSTTAHQPQQSPSVQAPSSPVVQLPSGQMVNESQIFDQVVARFSGSVNGESGKMVLRLQPAELGSLRIELKIEGDRVQANLQAQSQQVQEVLERNLPQLRSALAEQGLKIDQFQVDVNREQGQQQFEQLAQDQQRQDSQARPRWQQSRESEEQIIPLAHLVQNGGGGISLHV